MIDSLDVIRELRKVVAGREDYVYNSGARGENCKYVDDDGEPSCLIGHLLMATGWVSYDELVDNNTLGISHLASPDFFTDMAMRVMEVAQRAQDRGATWGEALGMAEAQAAHD